MEDIGCEDVAVDAGKEEPGEAAQTDSSTVRAFLMLNFVLIFRKSFVHTKPRSLCVR